MRMKKTIGTTKKTATVISGPTPNSSLPCMASSLRSDVGGIAHHALDDDHPSPHDRTAICRAHRCAVALPAHDERHLPSSPFRDRGDHLRLAAGHLADRELASGLGLLEDQLQDDERRSRETEPGRA